MHTNSPFLRNTAGVDMASFIVSTCCFPKLSFIGPSVSELSGPWTKWDMHVWKEDEGIPLGPAPPDSCLDGRNSWGHGGNPERMASGHCAINRMSNCTIKPYNILYIPFYIVYFVSCTQFFLSGKQIIVMFNCVHCSFFYASKTQSASQTSLTNRNMFFIQFFSLNVLLFMVSKSKGRSSRYKGKTASVSISTFQRQGKNSSV
jgi:hypothetical protein